MLSASKFRSIGGRLDAENGHSRLLEILQEVTVVAGQLDDQRFRPEREAPCHDFRVAPRVIEPAGRVRGKVDIVLSKMGRSVHIAELDQPAAVTHHYRQRIKGLTIAPDAFRIAEMVGHRA